MQTQNTPAEIARRFTCVSTTKPSEEKVTSETIAAQIEEFEKRGGKIKTIETPQPSIQPKRIAVGHDPQFLERTVAPVDEELVNLTQAAKILKAHVATVSNWARERKLKVVRIEKKTRAKMLKLSDVLEFKQNMKRK